jgi:hypothetical protein
VRRIALGLVHHPVRDRAGATVTTAVTNLDIHDIARSAHTFGVSDFFIIHPIAAQRELVQRVRTHWVDGSGAKRIPDRKPAMEVVRIVETVDDALAELERSAGAAPEIWSTSASRGDTLAFGEARAIVHGEGPPLLVLFGTGWGLADEVLARASARLEPILSPRADGYNHLSVRAAAAIILHRLLGV